MTRPDHRPTPKHPTRRCARLARRLTRAAPLLLATGGACAYAADPAGDGMLSAAPVSGSVGISSQYVSRGLRQSDGNPAGQATLEVAHPSGWTAGSKVTNVSDRVIDHGSVEWDLYGGYRGTAGPLGWSALMQWTRFPGARSGATGTAYDYTELVAGVSWQALYARYNYTVSRDFFGIPDARGTGYLDVGAHHDIGRTLTLNLHAGDGHVAGSGNDAWSWRDLKAGLTHRLDEGWLMSLNYTRSLGANGAADRNAAALGVPRPGGPLGPAGLARRAVVLSLTRNF